ncbi:glycosyltransferase family 4 protein [Methanosphaera sp. ISO3-F5]|uniref:glycosyltransferase family 4 protein n=1 Tax=Methanosphaera sp. ISO3-F5 TaxID=1452353 RepID=UPI002B2587FE|nr:glycosyltransferase family 4 protein [Methanosphaera sp. ISO3-F5]WQH64968.1 glycosyltransferase family 4 protein [Methanosphaera sp. ISO3-F5]
MKVIQTPVRFYPFIGGVEKYVYYISKELVKYENCDVKVICANEPENVSEEVYNDIVIKRLGYTGKIANTNVTLSLPKVLYNEDFDIIHTHVPTPWSSDWSNIFSRIKNKPLVVTYHNDIIGEGIANTIANIYNSTALKLLLNRANKIIITQDDYIQSPHLQKYKDKITTIPNGVDTSLFTPTTSAKKDNQIFFLSVLDKFHKYKGLDYLLDALVEVKKVISDVKLVVGGKGSLLEFYKNKVKDLGLEDNVEFKGFLTDEEVISMYQESELFVLPSISSLQEGFGIVVLEALSCETPVISTTIVGVSDDVINTDSGIIVPPRDVDKLTGAIIKILSDKKLIAQMGKKGRQLVQEKYEWKSIAKSIHELYEELL